MLFLKYLILLLLTAQTLSAHQSHENYMVVEKSEETFLIQCEIETDNFSKVLAIDDNNNTIVSWRELRVHEKEISDYLLKHLLFMEDEKRLSLHQKGYMLFRRDDQTYMKITFESDPYMQGRQIELYYDLFFDMDPLQRMYITLKENTHQVQMALSSQQRSILLEAEQLTLWQQFKSFFIDGLWHIWTGFDHLLFLLMLVLPTMVIKRENSYIRVDSKKALFWSVLRIVTLFSIAHSLTLGIAFFDYARINVKLIETLILISIMITALFNIFKIVPKRLSVLVFFFGLIHGFGFANALEVDTLDQLHVVLTLLGFNLGIEAGQIVIVAIAVPLLYHLAAHRRYERWIIPSVSLLTLLLTAYWLTLLFGY